MLHLLSRLLRPAEAKASRTGAAIALYVAGRPLWTPRDYAALAREGFQRNPVVHRAVRLVAEAAAALPLSLIEGGRMFDAHPLLSLLKHPNPREGGARFLESVYGHLLVSGNAYLEAVAVEGAPRELYACGPTACAWCRGRTAGPPPTTTRSARRRCASRRRAKGTACRRSCTSRSSIRPTTITASRRWRRRPCRSTSTTRRAPGTRRSSTTRRAPPAPSFSQVTR